MTLASVAFVQAVVSLWLQDEQQGRKAMQGPQHMRQADSTHLCPDLQRCAVRGGRCAGEPV